MATRLKTVHYAFPTLASLVNNTLTTLTQITLYLPESSKVFRSVVARLTCDDIVTAGGGSLTTKTLNLRLGAAGYTSVSNTQTLTTSVENLSLALDQDFTAHFTTNWTGTSMTCDFQVQINQSSGTTLNMVNVSVTLEITYEYDDASATQIKSVWIPLDMNAGAIATAATTRDTIPALDTYLPEASKTYRDIFVVVQGMEGRNGATTDYTMTLRVGAASVTTGNYEGALASDRLIRYVWRLTGSYPDTAATQTWQPTGSAAVFNHMQAWMVVTYEYDEAATTSVMNSVVLPMEIATPMGGTTATDYQRATREFWIQEPGTITTNRVAFFVFWEQQGNIGGLNMRVGTGSFVAYTDTNSQLCGSNAAMVRNDAAYTLARGRNSIGFDLYRTDATDRGFAVSGFWILNYTSSKSAKGTGAHNHTVFKSVIQNGTGGSAATAIVAATAFPIPETTYFMNAVGFWFGHMMSGTTSPTSWIVQVERLAAEGGVAWETVMRDNFATDPEAGVRMAYATCRELFKRWPTDPETSRMDIETNRRWRWDTVVGAGFVSLDWVVTYHDITYTVGGNITGFTGTVDLDLVRRGDNQVLQKTTRSGDGAYAFTVYDNVEPVYVRASDGTNKGVTLALPAPGSP